MNLERIAALRCAVELLDGEGGGYSPEDKYKAKLELMKAILEEEGKK
jgi:hypothetical protein